MFTKSSVRSFSTSIPRALKVSTVPTVTSPVSSLKVLVKGAGSKDTPSGLSHLLASSAFLDTASKSALRLKRESELLGGSYKASVTRDALVLEATFLKEDLPFFVNAIGSTLTETSFKNHEFNELVLPFATYTGAKANSSPSFEALEELHAISFKRGLGQPLYYDGVKSYSAVDLSLFAESLYTSENVEIIGSNVVEEDLARFVKESPLSELPAAKNETTAEKPKQKTYTGVESRIRKPGQTVAVIGLPVASADVPTYKLVSAAVVSAIPDTYEATVKADVLSYEQSGLLYVSIASDDAAEVGSLLKKAAAALEKASGSSLTKYKPLASYIAGADGSSAKDLESAKTSVKIPKFNLVVVGDVDSVPLADEL
ncbi:DEKNAAC103007 [Brettanomyces naardenensis]|uniref:Cytochrome b-c1 complex subunit 2, mitochondrial n=1 Tax=Brettanomyces naardenensis TaxID=13370 RepID=A0A448YMA9_BRENA|nr:DEKNAAC103007 [Brettanomyces naardenensis]